MPIMSYFFAKQMDKSNEYIPEDKRRAAAIFIDWCCLNAGASDYSVKELISLLGFDDQNR